MAMPAAAAPEPWIPHVSRSVGRTYLFHPGTQERLWLLDEQPAGVIATWGWKLVDASAPEKGRVYVHLRTGAQQHAAPASHDAAPAGSNSAGSSASGAAVSSVGSKRSFVAASDGSSSGSAVPDAKKSRAADSADREPKGSGGASALPEKSDAPALRPPTDLDVSDIHFGAPHDSSPGLAPIIPAALISAVRDLSKSRRGIGLPAERPAHDPFYHGWFFPAHKVVLKELLNEDTKLIIELGCWLGKSLFFMAQCAPNAVLLTIDLWDNTFIVNVQGDHYCNNERQVNILKTRPLYETFISNAWHLRERVMPLRMTTEEGVALLADALGRAGVAPDLIYIDADHHYAPAKRDIEACIKAFPSAHIVGDDYDYPDVRRAAHELGKTYGRKVHAEQNKCWTFSAITGTHRAEFAAEHAAAVAAVGGAVGGAGATAAAPAVPAAMREEFDAFASAVSSVINDDASTSDTAGIRAVLTRFLGAPPGRAAAGAAAGGAGAGGAGGPVDPASKAAIFLGSPLTNGKGPCKGVTLMHGAARAGRVAVVSELLTAWGAASDVNSTAGKGRTTPLGVAAFYGHAGVVRALLEHGADRSIRNGYGELPLDAAKKEMRAECVTLLQA